MSHYPQPWAYGPYQPPPAPPPSHLAWAIATAVLCCPPLSIVSIVYASRVDRLWMLGQYDEAGRASRLARNWAIVSAALVGAFYLVVVLVVIIGAATESASG